MDFWKPSKGHLRKIKKTYRAVRDLVLEVLLDPVLLHLLLHVLGLVVADLELALARVGGPAPTLKNLMP